MQPKKFNHLQGIDNTHTVTYIYTITHYIDTQIFVNKMHLKIKMLS